jgi:hypothetical protein
LKTTEIEGVRGYDAAKQIKGRKRHLLVDTLGLLLLAVALPRRCRNVMARGWSSSGGVRR